MRLKFGYLNMIGISHKILIKKNITLFKSTTMLCGTENIPYNNHEYSPHSILNLNVGNIMLSVPQSIIMDMNNVMNTHVRCA